MQQRILITGSSGLIGASLYTALKRNCSQVVGLDLLAKGYEYGDIRDSEALCNQLSNCTGVVHLAAVSRVAWGEDDPDSCWSTNVDGMSTLIECIKKQPIRPWLIFASSREVYGQPEILPCNEETPYSPVNVYARTKVEGEKQIMAARAHGFHTAIIRLANVYGSINDHIDRVVPAFARAAANGTELRVDGQDHTFDFTHIDDTVRAFLALIDHMENSNTSPPPIQVVTGEPITLGALALLAIELANSKSTIHTAAPRSYDVSGFFGDPERIRQLLNWQPRVSLRDGLAELIEKFRSESHKTENEAAL